MIEPNGDKMDYYSELSQEKAIPRFDQNEVYRADLISDGIRLIVPKNKAKIAKLKFLIKSLEDELDEKGSESLDPK